MFMRDHILKARIRQRIKELATPPQAVSLKAGLEKGFVSDFINDSRGTPDDRQLIQLAEALETSVDWLEAVFEVMVC